MQRRWFLSYNSQDLALVKVFESALRDKDVEAHIFVAPMSLRAGCYWMPDLVREIAEATAFVLVIGEHGVGPWQVLEYYEALDRRVKQNDFALVLVLLDGQPAPGLPFLRQLHWIITADPASEKSIAQVIEAAAGGDLRPRELWRHTAPYRGLTAMSEADTDFFFGRGRETVDVINALAAMPDKIPVLLGNSGVGKSSLARAGVLAAFIRQAWPETAESAGAWPEAFHDSRRWCFLILRPGPEPVRSLVEIFLETWQLDRTSTEWPKRLAEWVDALLGRKLGLRDLLDQTKRRYAELQYRELSAFFVYIDQGEELFVRAEQRHRRCFSEVLAEGVADPRLYALMSLRADFFGELQKDEPLYGVHRQINVAPLREIELREVVSRPAALLSARFETDHLAADIASRAAEESSKDAGALPLLSYLLDDMWRHMVQRGDGVLRLSAQSIELGRVLVDRANAFIAGHPNSEEKLRRIFTLKLATVREDGEPSRRRAWRSEFSGDEWLLVTELADHPNRLLITATPEASAADLVAQSISPLGETYTEVAHEAIFRRWEKLREWIAAEREFLAWRSSLEAARRVWQSTPDRSKADALLMGLTLAQAQRWHAKRSEDIPEAERQFIILSRKVSQRRKLRGQALIGLLAFGIVAGLVGWFNQSYLQEFWRWFTTIRPYMLTQVRPYVLTVEAARALKPQDSFRECRKDCPEMVVVPAGDFTMGSSRDEKGHRANEEPQHKVVFAKAFAVSKFEVTFDEWDVCVAYGDCPHVGDNGWGRGQQPVINVSWDDAQRYVAWFSRVTGKPYRLLSEAEWEYAARAGTQTAYLWGEEIGSGNANCNGCGSRWDNTQPASVGSFAANRFGLYDMSGNVWQWVEDCYYNSYNGTPQDGSARTADGHCDAHVGRGGSWYARPEYVRSAARDRWNNISRNSNLGFRIATTP